jgi:hypothetical protein
MDLLQDIIEDVKILKEAHQKAQESQELKPQVKVLLAMPFLPHSCC